MAKRSIISVILLRVVLGAFSMMICAVSVQAGETIDPIDLKIKMKDEKMIYRMGFGWGYQRPNFSMTWDFVFYEPSTDAQLSYIKIAARQKTSTDWWYGGEWRFSSQPRSDYQRFRLSLEKAQRRSWSFSLWKEYEKRQTGIKSTLHEYAFQELGMRGSWYLCQWFSLSGELKKREKDYETSPNSWVKYDLSTTGEAKFGDQSLSLSFKESTGEYPDNAWGNYWSNGFGGEWQWRISPISSLQIKGARSTKEWGDGKGRIEDSYSGTLEFPKSGAFTLSWLGSYKQSHGWWEGEREEDSGEDPTEDLKGWRRLGVRLEKERGPFTFRSETFHGWEQGAEKAVSGWLLIIRWDKGKTRWELGVTPQGGFNLSEEKGYWIRMRYYL